MILTKVMSTSNLVDQQMQEIKKCLKFTAAQNNSTIKLVASNSAGISNKIKINYYDPKTKSWHEFINEGATSITIVLANIGDHIYLKSQTNRLSISINQYYKFQMSGKIKASGNIMSLVNFKEYVQDYEFNQLFINCGSLLTSPKLPATTLATSCYRCIFLYCNNLSSAPELPATTLAYNCYYDMFLGCGNLSSAPELPATTLANNCYENMFVNCRNLISAPELSATILAESCYSGMFNGCTSLVNAPELPATNLMRWCYRSMFYNCTSLINAPELPATTLADACYSGMFNGCTSLTTTPQLPAFIIYTWAYQEMFKNCTSLVRTTELSATTVGFYACASMFQNCISLSSGPSILSATIYLNAQFYKNMFKGCINLKNAPQLPSKNLHNNCYEGMFAGCTSLTKAPDLPAITLKNYCYQDMFSGCINLSSINVSFENWHEQISATNNWLSNVANLGEFSCSKNLTQIRDASHIPNNWDINLENYLTFIAMQNNSAISLNKIGNPIYVNLRYKLNDNNWQTYIYDTIIQLSANSKIKFKGQYIFNNFNQNNYYQFAMTGLLSSYGNIDSLYNNSSLIDYQYYKLFEGCSSLINAPKLEYMTLTNNCYNSMFKGCTNLSAAPQLPAITLSNNCYNSMFQNCINLTQISYLPATSLVTNCYSNMFENCTNLSSVSVDFTEWNEQGSATTNWLNNVASNGQFWCLSGLMQIRDNSHIPADWDRITKLNYIIYRVQEHNILTQELFHKIDIK